MNHVFRVIWSHALRTWVVVAENVKGKGKSSSRKLVAAALAVTASVAHAAPTGGQVTAGAGSITQSGTTTTINQSSQNLSLNWQSFNVGSQETVDFVQPSASAIAINRILGNNGSVILGHLNANGQVYLINPNGVLFGEGAQVNVGGLVASTLDISDSNAAGSVRSFSGNGSGSIINQGSITAANGGYVAFLGNHVGNQGTVTAQLGTVAMGAGNAVTLNFNGNSLVHMQVDQSVLKSLAENGGLIRADGGQVIMTAGAKNSLLASVVNNTGVIEAHTVQNHNGTIELLGGMTAGTVNVGGTLDASAPNGGDGGAIETSAASVKVANGTAISTLSAHGKTGSWLIDPQDFTVAATGGDITGATLSNELASSNVTLQSSAGTNSGSGNVNINDAVSWSANNILTLTASNNVNFNANVTATGNTAGLVINPNTANGSETASGTGTYNLNSGASVTLSGATPSLTISGQAYTVINSLGNSPDDYYGGTSLQGMAASAYLNGHYALGSNIDASATSSWNSGQGFFPIGSTNTPFTGTLEGLGHTISNLKVGFVTSDYQMALFGKIGTTGVVQDLGLVGGSMAGHYGVGSVAADNAGTIRNVYSSATVNGVDMVGGLVGRNEGTIVNSNASGTVNESSTTAVSGAGGLLGMNYGGTVSNSYATGRVGGSNYLGGLVGTNFTGTITESYASGSVSGKNFVGGLVGESRSTISDSYATGNVTSSGTFAGGLVGRNDVGTISNSYATGNVFGTIDAGGLVGGNYATITNTYAVGSVTGTSGLGGLVAGTKQYGTVLNSYWDTQTTGQATSMGGSGLTTAQMQTGSNFSGFAFTNTPGATGNAWVIVDLDGTLNNSGGALGGTFPMLASEYSTTITNGHQLQLVAMSLNANYVMTANIDLTATNTGAGRTVSDIWSTGAGFIPLGYYSTNNLSTGLGFFSGTFDGRGHTISNLTINMPSASDVGLFGATIPVNIFGGNGGTISNVGLVGGTVVGGAIVGGLVGWDGGSVANSYSSTNVSAVGTGAYSEAGGLLGLMNSGSISASHASGSVSGTGLDVGGLIGATGGNGIDNSYATGNVTGGSMVGGLVGSNGSGAITNSHASGNVVASNGLAGGLAGSNSGNVSNSYADGNVSGGVGDAGGLVGANSGGSITHSFATGSVSGISYSGGLVGSNYDANVVNDYATGAVSGSKMIGGLIGVNGGAVNSSYATGQITSTWYSAGGLVGSNSGTISNSYASGGVIGPQNVGGLVGLNTGGTISDSYAIGPVSGSSAVGALVGSNASNGVVSNSFYDNSANPALTGIGGQADVAGTVWGMSPSDMETKANFTSATSANGNVNPGWDFTSGQVWGTTTSSSASYPILPVFGAGNVVQQDQIIYVDPVAGSSIYGSTANIGYVLDTSPIAANGSIVSNVTVAGTDNWFGSPTTTSNVGSYPVVFAGGLNVTQAGNYALAAGNAVGWSVTPAPITFSFLTPASKVYDGTDTAYASYSQMNGVLNHDNVYFTGIGTFASSNAGNGIAVDFSQSLTGSAAGNYYVVQSAGLTANITPAPLTVSGQSAASKVYDGTNVAATTGGTLVGVLNGDNITLSTSAVFPSKNAGTGLTVTATDTISGTGASNYALVEPTGMTANISPVSLTVNATGGNRTYNGSVNDAVTLSTTGIIAGDTVNLTDVSANFANKNVGASKTVTVTGIGLNGTDSGNYVLANTSATTTANITPATLTVTGETAGNKVYNGSTADTVSGGALSGLVAGDSVTLAQAGSFASKNAGTAITVNANDSISGADAGNYILTQPTGLTANITPATLTVNGETAASRVYNGSTAATLTGGTLAGVVAGDSVTLTQAGTFASKNVGNGIAVAANDSLGGADAGNYILTEPAHLSANITPLAITVTATGNNMVYNGTTTDPVTLSSSGVVAGDSVSFTDSSASFASKNVGTNLAVSVSGIGIAGTNASDYTLTNRSASTTASITPATLTVTGETATNKVYNGTTAATLTGGTLAGLAASDRLTLTQTGSFASKNVGTGIAVNVTDTISGTGASNYVLVEPTVVGNITPATITVTAAGTNMVYNGTVNDTVKLSSSGIVAGDVVSISDSSATFASKNVGTNLAVTVAGLALSGADAGNYQLASSTAKATASITPAPLTVTGETAAGKVYNGSTAATLSGGSLVGVIAGDTVTLNQAGSFASKNAGTNVAVTVADSLGGVNASDYSIVQPTGVTASITPASLTVTGETASNRVYNGTTTDTLTGGKLTGVIAGDSVTLVQTGTFASKNVGTGIAVTVADSLTGTAAGNYTLVQPSGTLQANITPLALTVTATGSNMVYNGTVNDNVTLTSAGVVAGDAVSFSDTAATFASKNVGTGIRVTVTGISMSGANAGDYTLSNTTASTTANITPATLTVTGETAATKTYNASTAATLSGGSLVGVLAGDTVTLNQIGSFASKNAGSNVAVTVADTLSGANASDYVIAQPTNVTGTINPALLTVLGQRASNIVYNGSTADPQSGGHLQGLLPGDTVTLTMSGYFVSPNIGNAVQVIATDVISGAQAGNYILVQPTGLSANITKP